MIVLQLYHQEEERDKQREATDYKHADNDLDRERPMQAASVWIEDGEKCVKRLGTYHCSYRDLTLLQHQQDFVTVWKRIEELIVLTRDPVHGNAGSNHCYI